MVSAAKICTGLCAQASGSAGPRKVRGQLWIGDPPQFLTPRGLKAEAESQL